MVVSRICPNCNNELKDHESYFCSACGTKLEDHLVRHTSTFQPRRKKFVPAKRDPIKLNFKFNHNVKVALLILVGFVVLSGLAMFLTNFVEKNQKVVNVNTQSTRKADYSNTLDLSLPQSNIVFGSQEITKYIPENVDFYVEGNDFETFYKEFYANTSSDSYFREVFEVSLNDRFALFGRKVKSEWKFAIVAELSEEELDFLVSKKKVEAQISEDGTSDELEILEEEDVAESTESEVSNDEELMLEVIDEVAVITNYDEFLLDIDQSATGYVKNVTHNQKFSSFSAFLPPDGQLIFMNFTQGFNDLFDLMLSFNPAEDVVKMLEQVSLGQYDKFVIRNNE